MHIDLGEISEDIIPNNRLDSEDKLVDGIRNNKLDPGEDIGLDGMAGEDPSDFWDLNQNNIQDWNEPASYDDWEDVPCYYLGNNGTEGNSASTQGKKPDTEDLNNNGRLDTKNNYYEFSIDLDKESPDTSLMVYSNPDRGWATYRIDLSDPAMIVGEPNPWKPFSMRIWIDGFHQKSLIRIGIIDFIE